MPSWRLWFNLEYVTVTVQLNSNIVQTPKTTSKALIMFPTTLLLFLSCHHSQHKLTSTRKPYQLLSTLWAQHQHPALIPLPYTYHFFLICSSPLHSPVDLSFRTRLLETVPTSLLGPRALIFISVKKHFITSLSSSSNAFWDLSVCLDLFWSFKCHKTPNGVGTVLAIHMTKHWLVEN